MKLQTNIKKTGSDVIGYAADTDTLITDFLARRNEEKANADQQSQAGLNSIMSTTGIKKINTHNCSMSTTGIKKINTHNCSEINDSLRRFNVLHVSEHRGLTSCRSQANKIYLCKINVIKLVIDDRV